MDELIKNTTDYFDYLINEVKICASVHFLKEMYPKINPGVMLAITPYIIHRNPYCLFVGQKRHPDCLENQREMICSFKGKEPIVHTCFAGASEIVYPILKDSEPVGFLSVNGYRMAEGEEKCLDSALWHSQLDPEQIPRKLTDVLIPPLRLMIEKLLEYESESAEEINLILRYIADKPGVVNLDRIAKHFGRSKSHISHLFKTKTGKTIRAYSNDLKLKRAKNLLGSTALSVTEIALETGFEDTSYFVRLFKEKYGETPYKYRKSNLTLNPYHSIIKTESN